MLNYQRVLYCLCQLFDSKKVVFLCFSEVLNETEAERSHTIFPFAPLDTQSWDVVAKSGKLTFTTQGPT